MPNTDRVVIPAEVNNFYDRTLLDRAVPSFVHNRFAEVRDIPANSGTDTIKFRRYGSLTAQTTPLADGVNPSGKQLSITDLTATVLYYGDYIVITDKLITETYDPILTETAEILGDQAGDSLDKIARDIFVAGASIQYASTATAQNEITAAMKITREEVKQTVRTLKGGLAKPVTMMIDPATGYNTMPIGKSFIGICSEDVGYDLDDCIGWTPVEKYPNKSNIMDDEIGSLANVRFIETTNAKVSAGAGANGNDVHHVLIFGRYAFAQTRISGKALQNIVHAVGSGGTSDALNMISTSGWKATYVAKVLNSAYVVDLQVGVSA